jgi:chorismate lyase/3-hydroxybenzoate synthase
MMRTRTENGRTGLVPDFSRSRSPEEPRMAATACQVFYARDPKALTAPALQGRILGVIGYGTARPSTLDPACPFAVAPLLPADGVPVLEVWTTETPTTVAQRGRVKGAYGGGLVFAVLELREDGGHSLEDEIEAAYLEIFDFLDDVGGLKPIRFWNYLTKINDEQDGLERYRRFNLGRRKAFEVRLRQAVPPAASGVGGDGASLIYLLAAQKAATAVENPRQVSAYAYPPIYGPASPGFSRAALHETTSGPALFISGTASIVGHETRHQGVRDAQLAETIENLRALMNEAGHGGATGNWAVKTYLRTPSDRHRIDDAVTALFGVKAGRVHLRADICRTDLLLEIEAYRHPGD